MPIVNIQAQLVLDQGLVLILEQSHAHKRLDVFLNCSGIKE